MRLKEIFKSAVNDALGWMNRKPLTSWILENTGPLDDYYQSNGSFYFQPEDIISAKFRLDNDIEDINFTIIRHVTSDGQPDRYEVTETDGCYIGAPGADQTRLFTKAFLEAHYKKAAKVEPQEPGLTPEFSS